MKQYPIAYVMMLASSLSLVACGASPTVDGDDGAVPDAGIVLDGQIATDADTPDAHADDGAMPDASVPAARPFILDRGHIDLFEVTYDQGLGALVLSVKDDTELYGPQTAFRTPEDVTIAYDAALVSFTLPEDLPVEYDFLGGGGTTIFLADITQQDGVPWAGWSTERLPASLPEGVVVPYEHDAVTLAVSIDGPGDVFTFMTDGVGLPISRFVDTTDEVPDVIPIHPSTHVHTAWAFTLEGDYVLTVTPSARTSTGAMLSGRAFVYHMHVGPSLFGEVVVPEVTLAGGLPMTYAVGDTVTLTATSAPAIAGTRYGWYRWDDATEDSGFVPFEGTSDTLVFLASRSELVLVVLFDDATGRVLGQTAVNVTVTPPP